MVSSLLLPYSDNETEWIVIISFCEPYSKNLVFVLNRYRWPSLVWRWDWGLAMFMLLRKRGRLFASESGAINRMIKRCEQGMRVVIIHGKQDEIVPFERSEKLKEQIPGALLIPVEDCGHLVYEEKPQEFVAEILKHIV